MNKYKLIINCSIKAENNGEVDNKSKEIVDKIRDCDIVVKSIRIVKLKERK